MLPIEPGQCSIAHQLLATFVSGLVGSIGIFINMIVIGSVMQLYKRYKLTRSTIHVDSKDISRSDGHLNG